MSLKQNIETEIKSAMLAKDKDRLRALRAIKSAILLAESEKGFTGKISEEKEMSILMKAAKQRKDSLDIFKQQGRDDLAEKEQLEIVVIEEFLPAMMSKDQITVEVKKTIQEVGATGASDMGKVMGVIVKKLAGKADGKEISSIVKEELAS